jgi:hypothetical protein
MAKKRKDEGLEETDLVLDDLEKRIAKEYATAEQEVAEKLSKYIERYIEKNTDKLDMVANGEMTVEEYENWLIGQMAIGSRWQEMRETLAEDYTNAAEIAKSVSFGYMPEVYKINHDYGTFQVEKASKIDTSYTLYPRQAVERLFKGGTFYPAAGKALSDKIKRGEVEAWNEQNIQSAMIQGLLQGEGIPAIVKRIRKEGDRFTAKDIKNASKMTAKQVARAVERKNRIASTRDARTMTTYVQNVGREDSYKRAEGMGIELKQEWIATLDSRTRHAHRQLDGQKVDIGKPFHVDGYDIECPADPKAPAYLVYNCRCCIAPVLKSFDSDYSKDLSDRNTDKLGDMSYEEWKNAKAPKATEDKTESKPQETKAEKQTEVRPKMNESAQKDYENLKKWTENIKRVKVEKNKGNPTEADIIKKLAGGDLTEGSCASLTQAFCANYHGYDVKDFRGGKSQETFSIRSNIVSAFKIANAEVIEFVEYRAKDVSNKIKDIEIGKPYALACGRHSAVIRKTEDGELQYLELQSQDNSGWQSFTPIMKYWGGEYQASVTETLHHRFGCTKSKSKFRSVGYLVDISTMQMTDEYLEIIEAINTETGEQRKGAKGGRK